MTKEIKIKCSRCKKIISEGEYFKIEDTLSKNRKVFCSSCATDFRVWLKIPELRKEYNKYHKLTK